MVPFDMTGMFDFRVVRVCKYYVCNVRHVTHECILGSSWV